MAKQRTKRNKTGGNSLLVNLLKIKSPYHAVRKLKFEYNRSDVEKNFSKLISHNLYKRYINDITFPTEYKTLESYEALIPKGTLEQELWWNTTIVTAYKNEISEFNILYMKYYNLFFYGDFEKAMECLLDIERRFGLSNWLIENKIMLLSKKDGLKEQKEYLEFIRELLPPTASLLTFYISLKVETEVSYEQFNRVFHKLWEDHENIKNYFFFKFSSHASNIDELDDVLHKESEFSIIDRYLVLKKVMYIILSDDSKYNIDSKNLKKVITKLNSIIEDKELKPLVYIMNIQDFDSLNINNQDYVEALDAYTEGNYKKAFILCKNLLENKSEYWLNIVELLIKCEIRDDENQLQMKFIDQSLIDLIYKCFKSILQKDKDLVTSTKKLLKIALEMSNNPISNNIALFIYRQLPFFNQMPTSNTIEQGKISSILYDIRNRDIFNINEGNTLIKQFNANYKDSTTYQLIDSNSENVKIPIYRRDKYKVSVENASIKDEDKIEIYTMIIKNCNILDRYDAIIELCQLLFKLKRIEECLECIIDGYLENSNLIYSLPIKEITEHIAEVHKFDFNENISISILYDLYSRYISPSLDEVKAIRCEMFLETNSYSKPSELIKDTSIFAESKLNYYLENICTMKTLDSFLTFSSTQEVEAERINICQYLVENGSSNSEKLLKEIKNITESSLISKSIVEIEQNKIYVNTEGIKEKLNPILNEYYLRYKNLVNNVGDLRERLRNQYILNVEFKFNNAYPKNDIMPLLFHALLETKDYFVFSSEYGLVGFLSTNIRHGKLYNFLSSSLLSSNLIIKNESTFWNDYYKMENTEELIPYLQDFTNHIDSIINNFVNKYIQIKTLEEEKKYALFDYSFKEQITIPLYIDLEEDPTFEDFQNRILDIFWLKTERNLESIREKISNELSTELNNEFKVLDKNLENLSGKLDISHIRDLVKNEQIHMQRKIENLLLWFTRQTSSNVSDFEFSLANDITYEVITNVHVNNKLDIHLNIENSAEFKGFMLKGLVDILFILYDNAINNYKKKENIDLQKYFSLTFKELEQSDFRYKISVENYINKDTNTDLLNQKLDEIKENIRTKMFGKRVATEGGTGFYKIVKILRYDLNLSNSFYLDFYIDKENYKFIVDIYFRRIQ